MNYRITKLIDVKSKLCHRNLGEICTVPTRTGSKPTRSRTLCEHYFRKLAHIAQTQQKRAKPVKFVGDKAVNIRHSVEMDILPAYPPRAATVAGLRSLLTASQVVGIPSRHSPVVGKVQGVRICRDQRCTFRFTLVFPADIFCDSRAVLVNLMARSGTECACTYRETACALRLFSRRQRISL